MSRTQRLFDLLQILRRHRYPLSGQHLANTLGISLRTLYRDIATLQSQGACIQGEPGIGYVLRPGFMLPPLMFSEEEIEALVLGSRWVAQKADGELQLAAHNILAKIAAVLPENLRHQLEYSGLLIGQVASQITHDDKIEALIRLALRKECKLQMIYRDVQGQKSQRIIWPLALGFFEERHVLVAFCESGKDFRHFRTDRIIQLDALNIPFPQRRQILLDTWRKQYNIPPQ